MMKRMHSRYVLNFNELLSNTWNCDEFLCFIYLVCWKILNFVVYFVSVVERTLFCTSL